MNLNKTLTFLFSRTAIVLLEMANCNSSSHMNKRNESNVQRL